MHCRGGVSLLMVFALVFGVLLVSCPAFAVQGGFSRPYTHYADDEDLTVILTNFAHRKASSTVRASHGESFDLANL